MEFTSPLLHVGLLLGREKILVTFVFQMQEHAEERERTGKSWGRKLLSLQS
jgi:hypothetical protein